VRSCIQDHGQAAIGGQPLPGNDWRDGSFLDCVPTALGSTRGCFIVFNFEVTQQLEALFGTQAIAVKHTPSNYYHDNHYYIKPYQQPADHPLITLASPGKRQCASPSSCSAL
jgi:hypothetical protein